MGASSFNLRIADQSSQTAQDVGRDNA